MTQYGTWASYAGDARIWLAIGLLAAAGGVVLAGIRLPLPIRFIRPGPAGRAATIAAWAASIAALLICSAIYVQQVIHVHSRYSGVRAERDRTQGPHRPGHRDRGRGRLRHHHLAQFPGPSGQAGQRRYRRDGRTDDLRASVRPSDRQDAQMPPDPAFTGPCFSCPSS